MSKRALPVFPSKRFGASGLTFRSLVPTNLFAKQKRAAQTQRTSVDAGGGGEDLGAGLTYARHVGNRTEENLLPTAAGTLVRDLWRLKWEGNPKGRGCVCTRGWFTLLYCRDRHGRVKQLYSSKNLFENVITFPNVFWLD